MDVTLEHNANSESLSALSMSHTVPVNMIDQAHLGTHCCSTNSDCERITVCHVSLVLTYSVC
jgi:hypothetical protein